MLAGYAIKNSILFYDFSIMQSMSSYGFPLLLANISAVILTVIDRFALNSLSVLKSVALYTLAFKITSVLKLVLVDSIKLAVGPMMIKRMYSPDNKRFYSKVLLYSSYVLMFAIVVISAYSFEAIKVLADAKAYWGAVTVIPLLSLSIFFVNMKEVTVYGLHIAKKTSIIGIIVIFSAVISLALNLLLIPKWDIMGAAFATLLTQLLYWLACYYFSQKVFPVPYETRKILLIVLTGLILSFVCQIFNRMEILPRLFLKTITVLSYPAILYLIRFYEPVELDAIRGFFKKWKRLDKLGDNIKSLKNIKDDF
jgi:O-antigen/teichoic acid export membrane protein